MGSLVVDPDKDHALVEELADPAARLFDRHLSVSKEWYPFEDVPWDNAADFDAEENSGTPSSTHSRKASRAPSL